MLSVLLVLGGSTGLLNLFVDGVVREGSLRWLYAGTMAACFAAAALLLARRHAGRRTTFGLVLLGDLIYVVVALSVVDPLQYSPPLMLLFPAVVAAWFLDSWMLGVHMVAIPVACLVALDGSYDSTAALLIQVLVSAIVLNSASFGVFVLRRRVERLLAATREASRRDPLTGLQNRRWLAEEAPRVWRQARRDGTRVAGMVLDLDHFKSVNDSFGHAAGDDVLRSVADSLSATVRPADLLARTGGEELVVVGLVSDPADAGHLAERLRAAVAGARSVHGHAVTTSIGIALTRPADGEDPVAALWRLIDRADAAMYEAKRAGRDRVAPPQPRSPAATSGEGARRARTDAA
jgi:diguanylate cyclase (GGDEF)-like protein